LCPTNWKKSPLESCVWIDEVMSKSFPLGVLVDRRKNAKKTAAPNAD